MEFLSLQEPVESPILKVGRSEAILASIGLHLLLLLLFIAGPGLAMRFLPRTMLDLILPQSTTRAHPSVSEASPVPAPGKTAARQPQTIARIPLKFEYVHVPNPNTVRENPSAPLLSDKNMKARQEVKTPPDARQFSIDPHSVGTSIERVKPDPKIPAGRADVEAQGGN